MILSCLVAGKPLRLVTREAQVLVGSLHPRGGVECVGCCEVEGVKVPAKLVQQRGEASSKVAAYKVGH